MLVILHAAKTLVAEAMLKAKGIKRFTAAKIKRIYLLLREREYIFLELDALWSAKK